MLKKSVIACGVLVACSTLAFANSAPYLGADLGLTNNTASTNNFRGVTGTLSAGYGATFEDAFYLGGELFGTLFTATLDNHGHTLRTTYGYGLSVIPGYLLSDHTMAFARLGVIRSRFDDLDRTVTGAQIGLGLQTSLTQNWDLRGEYDYTDYKNVSGQSPIADQFKLGVVYKFQ